MPGFPGQITSNSSAFATESLVLEKSSAPFGVVLVSDADGLCRLPDKADVLEVGASTGKAVGILAKHTNDAMLCNEALKSPIGDGEKVYAKVGEAVSLVRVGSVFVKTETTVDKGDAVFYRVSDGLLGSIRNDADSDKAVKLNGAVFAHGAKEGDIVQIDMNLNTLQESY